MKYCFAGRGVLIIYFSFLH